MDVAGPSESDRTDTCNLCNKQPRKYTCPRCGIGYCNVDCYKSEAHLDCSESFYKQCVEEELKTQESDPEARKKMVEILKRVHEQETSDDIFETDDIENEEESPLDSDDDENVPDLEERLRNINLDNPDELWSALTDAERQEFEALIKNGEAEKLLPQWIPWWTRRVEKKLIQDLEEDKKTDKHLTECPILIDVPVFSELQKASPNVCFNLVNVIYAYAYMALYYNGDYLNCTEEAVMVFLEICDNMKKNKVFYDVQSAKDSVVQNIINCNWLPQDELTMLTFQEAATLIIHGPEENNPLYISAALSELHRLLTHAKQEVSKRKKENKNKDFSQKFIHKKNVDGVELSRKDLLLYCKKVEYYLSWTKSNGSNINF